MRYTIAFLSLILFSTLPSYGQKKRVAVINFDYGTVSATVGQLFGSTNTDVGKGVADILVEKLVNSGVYSVIERKAIDKILAEQNFSNSDRADPNSAAKIGRILGVDAIVMGSITQFGRDDKQTNVGGGVLRGVTGKYGLGNVGVKNAKAVVALTARLVNTDTAEILVVANGRGESKRSGTSLLGSGGGSTAAGGLVDMTSSNFAASILGEATMDAVAALATQLDGNAGKLPSRTVEINGLVADVSGDTLILNVGSSAGVKVGDKLSVKRASREIRDPSTGKVIRRVEEAVGEITITEADSSSSVGKFSGPGKPKVGDTVK